MEITNTVALVTGANRGIGAALVHALLEQGASKVYAAARQEGDLATLRAAGDRRIVPVHLDVTNADEVGRLAEQARDVKLLVNNAGVLDFGSVLDASPAAFNRNFDVNFFGLLHVTRAFAPTLIDMRGAVVNLLTLVALASMPGLGVYNASKAAAWSLTQSLRADFAKRHVKVFSVFPGAVDTDMLKGVEVPKASPADVASDHKAIEHQFATM